MEKDSDGNIYLNNVIQWFLNMLIVFENSANSLDIYTIENGKYKKLALEILKRADIGISDFAKGRNLNIKHKISSFFLYLLQPKCFYNFFGHSII